MLSVLEARREVLREENETLAGYNRALRDWLGHAKKPAHAPHAQTTPHLHLPLAAQPPL